MELTYMGTTKDGRTVEIKRDGIMIVDPGPVLSMVERQDLRDAAEGYFKRTLPQHVTVMNRRRIVAPMIPVKQPQGVDRALILPGTAKPKRITQKWLGVKQLQTEAEMYAQLRTNYNVWLAQGASHGEVMKVLGQRIRPLVNGIYWKDKEAQVRLAKAWRRLEKEVQPAAS